MPFASPPPIPPWIESLLPPGVTRHCVAVGSEQMHVMEWGPRSGRPVLLVHGNPTWGFLYRKVVDALRNENLRLVVPDLIGLGYSSRCRADAHTLENHCRWLGELIDALDLRDLVFMGQDWGGPIGLGALAHRAERVSGMVILNTVVGPPRRGFKPTAFHRFSRMPVASDVAFRLLGFPQIGLRLAQGDKRSIRGKVSQAYREPLRGLRNNVAPLALARMVPDSQDHPSIAQLAACQEFLESFSGPISVVWGDRDPVLGSVLSWIRKLLPQASVQRTSAGHFLQEEVPEEIACAVREVVARIGGQGP